MVEVQGCCSCNQNYFYSLIEVEVVGSYWFVVVYFCICFLLYLVYLLYFCFYCCCVCDFFFYFDYYVGFNFYCFLLVLQVQVYIFLEELIDEDVFGVGSNIGWRQSCWG